MLSIIVVTTMIDNLVGWYDVSYF